MPYGSFTFCRFRSCHFDFSIDRGPVKEGGAILGSIGQLAFWSVVEYIIAIGAKILIDKVEVKKFTVYEVPTDGCSDLLCRTKTEYLLRTIK